MTDSYAMPEHLNDLQVGEATSGALSKTLLVIDDEPTMRKLVELTFRNELKQVLMASEAHEGLRLAMTYKPDVICSDNNMPGMEGIELLKYLSESPVTQHIPVIMLTGDSSEQAVFTAAKYKVAGYLLKPCDPEMLYDTVMKALGVS